jgi:hypothetical protein
VSGSNSHPMSVEKRLVRTSRYKSAIDERLRALGVRGKAKPDKPKRRTRSTKRREDVPEHLFITAGRVEVVRSRLRRSRGRVA